MDSIGKYDYKVQLVAEEAINKGIKNISRLAKNRVPVRSGKLKKSGRSRFDKKNMSGRAQFNASYAHIVEFGAKGHKVKPKNKKAMTVKGQGETTLTSKEASVPALPARPFLFPSFQEEVPSIEKEIREAMKKP
ncbi:MAG: HK97 gp10 family phage protein [Acidaminococcales bacterium]|nr:HK97 gp10 family phage protein [Acidaminococcales bacterium]